MLRFTSLVAVVVAAAGLVLASPSNSQAQGYGHGKPASAPGGYTPGFGGGYGGYNPGYGGYNPGYGGYNPGYGGYTPGFGGGFGRPTVVHPETLHWTPGRGLHTHGHIHVPHGGHSHPIPY